jgi:hypothetical protein
MNRFPSLTPQQYRWMAVLWTGAIVVACSIPAPTLSPLGPALSADKAIHLGLFAVFGGLWMRALCPPSTGAAPAHLRRYGLRVLGWGGLFAVGTEVYQHVMPLQRMGDPYDALANGVGLVLSVVGYVVLVRRAAESDPSPQGR